MPVHTAAAPVVWRVEAELLGVVTQHSHQPPAAVLEVQHHRLQRRARHGVHLAFHRIDRYLRATPTRMRARARVCFASLMT
jgi:hypothetical protein